MAAFLEEEIQAGVKLPEKPPPKPKPTAWDPLWNLLAWLTRPKSKQAWSIALQRQLDKNRAWTLAGAFAGLCALGCILCRIGTGMATPAGGAPWIGMLLTFLGLGLCVGGAGVAIRALFLPFTWRDPMWSAAVLFAAAGAIFALSTTPWQTAGDLAQAYLPGSALDYRELTALPPAASPEENEVRAAIVAVGRFNELLTSIVDTKSAIVSRAEFRQQQPAAAEAAALLGKCARRAGSGQWDTALARKYGRTVQVEHAAYEAQMNRLFANRALTQILQEGMPEKAGGPGTGKRAPVPPGQSRPRPSTVSAKILAPSKTQPADAEPAAGADMTAILAQLRSADPDDRLQGVQKLKDMEPNEMGQEVVEALHPLLNDDARKVRRTATEALAHWAPENGVPALIGLLRNPDADVRRAAFALLGQRGEPRAAQAVAAELKNDEASAVDALLAMGPLAEAAALDCYQHGDDRLRTALDRVLPKICTQQAVDRMTQWQNDADADLAQHARNLLGSLQPAEKK